MTPDPDVGIWKQISGWLWALLAVPLALLWRKADNAVPREEMREHLTDDKESHADIRETMKTLFEAAEIDRRRSDERFSKMQDVIHEIHVKVIERLGEHR